MTDITYLNEFVWRFEPQPQPAATSPAAVGNDCPLADGTVMGGFRSFSAFLDQLIADLKTEPGAQAKAAELALLEDALIVMDGGIAS